MNRKRFRIIEHPSRVQPYTVWRGAEVWWFAATRAIAEGLINTRLHDERMVAAGEWPHD